MEIHDLVAGVKPVRLELGHLGLDVVDREADVVEAELVQVADVGIGHGLGMAIAQQLDLGSRRRVLQYQGDMLGLDAGHAHVARERLSGDDRGDRLLESQYPEERLGSLDVPHHDGDMIEMLEMASSPAVCRRPDRAVWPSSDIGARALAIAQGGVPRTRAALNSKLDR